MREGQFESLLCFVAPFFKFSLDSQVWTGQKHQPQKAESSFFNLTVEVGNRVEGGLE